MNIEYITYQLEREIDEENIITELMKLKNIKFK